MLNKAIVFAVERHKGAFRKGTKIPYITHPLEALSIGATITNDLELLSACVLHDTLEDTNTTFNEIKEKFGLRVAKLVYFDSENKREGVSPEKTWEIRKNETLKRLETANRDEQIIVLSDKLSNLRAIFRDYKDGGEKFWDRFYCKDLNKQGWYYKSIAERLSLLTETHAYKEYCSILDEVFVQYYQYGKYLFKRKTDGLIYKLTEFCEWQFVAKWNLFIEDALHNYGDFSIDDVDFLSFHEANEYIKKQRKNIKMKESLNLRLLLAKEQFKKWTYGNKQNELFWDNVENKINKYIFECAFKGAYKDITLRTIKGVGQVKNLRQLCFDNLKELFNNYFTNKAPSTKEEFDNIHNIMCLNFLQAFNQALTNCNLPEQKYGKAQKIVNMLFKNLYCADIKEKKEYFTFCHMPIDSYILKWYFRDLAAKIKITKFKTCWSNLDFATYISVQNNIRDYLCEFGEKANLPNIVLEAEYCIWENEKNN